MSTKKTQPPIEIITRYGGLLTTTHPDADLCKAIASARAEFPHIAKNKTADMKTYQFKYASLGSILAAITPVLTENGVLLSQPIMSDIDKKYLVTRLSHVETGQFIEVVREIPSNYRDSRVGAGDETFWRRYSLNSLLSIFPEDDIDFLYQTNQTRGVKQTKEPPRRNRGQKAQPERKPKGKSQSVEDFEATLKDKGINPEKYKLFRDWAGYDSLYPGNAGFKRNAVSQRISKGGAECLSLVRITNSNAGIDEEANSTLEDLRAEVSTMFETCGEFFKNQEMAVPDELMAIYKKVAPVENCVDFTSICGFHDLLKETSEKIHSQV